MRLLLPLLLGCSAAFAQTNLIVNGDFSSPITANTTSIGNTSATGTWFGGSTSWFTDSADNTYDNTAVGRTGNSGQVRGLLQSFSGASVAIGDYTFSFDYTIVDLTATNATLSYAVFGTNNTTWSATVQSGTFASMGTPSGFTQVYGGTLSLNDTNGTRPGAIDAPVSITSTYSTYLVRFEIFSSNTTNNAWGPLASGANTSFVSLDNISLAAVPEPASAAGLAGLVSLGLVALRRRRQA